MKKIVLFILALFIVKNVQAAGEGWAIKADMPEAKRYCAAAAIDSMIYVVGGYSSSGPSATMYAYNVRTNTWSAKASMLHARGELAAVAVNGKLYVIGGYDGNAVKYVEEYNPATNTWASKADMPTARSQFNVAAVGNKIYAVGGWPSSFTTLEVYDVTANTWTTKAPAPHGKIYVNSAATLGGKIYFLGGKDYGTSVFYDSTIIYNPATDSWSAADTMPYHRFAGAAAVARHRIYYFGGATGQPTPNYNNNSYFDSATHTWHSALLLLNKRSAGVAVTGNNNKIYLISGYDSAGNTVAWNHEYSPDTIPSSVTNIANNVEISLYPNPAKEKIEVQLGNNVMGTVQLFSLSGQLIEAKEIDSRSVYFGIGYLPSGVYIIKLQSGDQIAVRQFVKE